MLSTNIEQLFTKIRLMCSYQLTQCSVPGTYRHNDRRMVPDRAYVVNMSSDPVATTLLTKTAAAQNNFRLSYHRCAGCTFWQLFLRRLYYCL